jgi:hypothetical protein
MKPGPSTVAEIILSELPLDAPPEALEDVITRTVVDHPEWQYVPGEKAALWAPKVKSYLSDHWKRSMEQGKQPRFSFNSVSDYKIQGGCFIEPCDSPEIKEQKRRRLRWRDYYDCLRGLDPEVFEKVCACILRLLGVADPVLTAYRADQGIDFFGRMSIGDLTGHGALFPVFETDLIFWLVGQAKHYRDSKISTPDLRALAGSVFLGRARAFPGEGSLPQLNIRACDPVIMLFFATGEISSNGWALCRRAGIVAMDGEMLAAFLADKQVGVTGVADTQRFSPMVFAEWLGVNPAALGNQLASGQ